MPKTEEMIHKQALDSAWSLLKFYGPGYVPHEHRVLANKKRDELAWEDDQIEELKGKSYLSDYERRNKQERQGKVNDMLEEEPDLRDRRQRSHYDSEPFRPDSDDYERGKATPASGSEDRVSTRSKMRNPESAPGESSFRTEGTGDSVMEPIPDWQQNPGNDPSVHHPMYRDDNRQSLMDMTDPNRPMSDQDMSELMAIRGKVPMYANRMRGY